MFKVLSIKIIIIYYIHVIVNACRLWALIVIILVMYLWVYWNAVVKFNRNKILSTLPGNPYHHLQLASPNVNSAMFAWSEYLHDFLLTTDDTTSGIMPMTSLSILGSDAVSFGHWLHQKLNIRCHHWCKVLKSLLNPFKFFATLFT